MADFARWVISPAPLNLPIRGSADQMIILTTRGNSVEGVIRFFGQLSFAVRLATNYTNAPIRCAYIVDPYREADPAEQRLNGDSLTQYDDQIPIFVEQSPGNNADVQAAWDAALNRFMAHYSERENEATVQKVVDESIQLDSRIAAMDRKDAEEMVRKLIQKRFAEFERTGQTDKLTVLRTRTGDGIKPIEDVAN
jgi:hypothetical protein